MVIDAISRRTGKVVASLHVDYDGTVATEIEGRMIPGFDGPFDNAAWQVGHTLLMNKLGVSNWPTLGEAYEKGILTPLEVANAMPDSYSSYTFFRR